MIKKIKIGKKAKKNTVKRLQILHKDEVTAIFNVPQFNLAEQTHFFELQKNVFTDLKLSKTNNNNKSAKLYFILQYGYFKARHQFFNFDYKEVKSDAIFIMKNFMPTHSLPHKLPARQIQRNSRNKILQLMKFSDDTEKMESITLNAYFSILIPSSRMIFLFVKIPISFPMEILESISGSSIWHIFFSAYFEASS